MTDKSYSKWSSMSDRALAEHIGRFIKEKRMDINKTQEVLAHAAGISRSTLSLLEKGVLRVLDQLHVLDAFTLHPIVSPIQIAKMEMKKRKRASGDQSFPSTPSTW
jgi:DNA-binding XRE family transcriptional regulator